MPENQRNQINQEIRDLRRERDRRQAFVVEIKVDSFGNSIPDSLWLGDNNYRF
ncbi:Putative membrane-anchored protein (fragment) [Hyella patelloides LEGE 07179]|uniref:Membrane-anchored protein n=2 Tax=Hyella TaxID=945733 RepID=A0A563VV05_9CYAN